LLEEVELGGEKSFIGAWYVPDLKICDELILYFKHREDKIEGEIGHNRQVNKDVKDSIDVIVTPDQFTHPIIQKYIGQNLREVTEAYTKKFEWAGRVNAFSITENINIQYYKPMMGYKEWHTERIGKLWPSIARHLVFMTYLNDVSDEGGTEFFYQKIKTQPRKGLTLIWPVDWTHLHRGIVSPTEEKYIITGWYNFL
jgi:prolyl 4-hydroxylase